MPRCKSNNLFQTRPKIKLLLQKNCKIFERWGFAPRPPTASGSWALPPYPKAQPSHCKFLVLHLASTGFIRSGKIRGKHIFFEMVRESQGESGKVREFNEKVREKLEKVRVIFLESSYLLWIKIHCFLRYNQSFLRYNYDRSPVKFLFLLLNWCFCVCMH